MSQSRRLEVNGFHNMHRLAPLIEQFTAMKVMVISGIISALAASHVTLSQIVNIFSAEPVEDANTLFCLLLAGSLGGAFTSTQLRSQRETLNDIQSWTRRMALSTVTGILLTPIILMGLNKAEFTVYGVTIHVVTNAPVVMASSYLIALLAKEIIRRIKKKGKSLIDDDEERS